MYAIRSYYGFVPGRWNFDAGNFLGNPLCREIGESVVPILRAPAKDVPVRPPISGANGVGEHPVGVVVVIPFRPRRVEEEKPAVALREVVEKAEDDGSDLRFEEEA